MNPFTPYAFGGVQILADKHCPTWKYYPHEGWRGFLIQRLRFPKKWFKPERKERVMYKVGNMIVCSPESYAVLSKAVDGLPVDRGDGGGG